MQDTYTENAKALMTGAVDMTELNQNMLLILQMGKIGNSRQCADKSKFADDTVDKTMISISKKLMTCDAYDKILKFDTETGDNIRLRSTPIRFGKARNGSEAPTNGKKALASKVFAKGIYIIPVKAYPYVDEYLEKRRLMRQDLIEALKEEYPAAIAQAREKLGNEFDENNYYDPNTLDDEFTMLWVPLEIKVPEGLAESDGEFYMRKRTEAENLWKTAMENANLTITAAFSELVEHMLDRLTPDADGKAKIFKGPMVENFMEFCKDFPMRNVGNDQELQAVVDRAQRILSGIATTDLRGSDYLKTTVANGMATIKAELDEMVTTRASRRIILEGDDPA